MRQVYPAPTVVVGVGRLGLAVLERLGDDWMGLRISGADASIQNVRLVAVRPEPPPASDSSKDGQAAEGESARRDVAWRHREEPGARVARSLGDGDLPSRALDLAVLRSLGLVRYRDGTYQVGIPQDDGAVEIEEEGEDEGGRASDRSRQETRRRRFFRWIDLSPDPIVAAERLRQVTERDRRVDLFLTPMLQRIRRGLSPRTLLATIGRWIALARGRDPSPWPWLRQALAAGETARHGGFLHLPVTPRLVEEVCCADPDPERRSEKRQAVRRAERHLTRRVEPPLLTGRSRWTEWRRWTERSRKAPSLALEVPERFVPVDGDTGAPLDVMEFLSRDWQAARWARDEGHPEDPTFLALETTPFRLGLFDHDGRSGSEANGTVRDELGERLEELGELVHQGLLRLWVDLQRVRASEADDGRTVLLGRQRDHVASALQQSLELLGELVVRPIASPEDGAGQDGRANTPRPGSRAERELPDEPSHLLTGLVAEERPDDDPVLHLLLSRLADLGLASPDELGRFRHRLLSEIRLAPEDLDEGEAGVKSGEDPGGEPAAAPGNGSTGGNDADRDDGGPVSGLPGLRRRLNQQVRQLFDFQLLTEYRKRPTRQPPRLSVFVVGDMSEPFTRASLRPILREIHAELLRAFTPLFQSFREGFDRSLCVTPILWMPHPADPFKGEPADCSRCEEAAIIDAVHGIRHWVECVLPPGRRFIPQIFINSRVTDTSTLTLRDAVRETRDFLTFQMRSDLASDPWLRRTSAGSGQSDLFASFSCFEIDFPALRCREYVANRLTRELLGEVQGRETAARKGPELPDVEAAFGPPGIEDLVGEAREEIRKETEEAAAKARGEVERRLTVHEGTDAAEVVEAFSPRFQEELETGILKHWDRLTGTLGRVDEEVDRLRIRIARGRPHGLQHRLQELRRLADRVIEEQVVEAGLSRALGALHRLRRGAGELFRRREEERRQREGWAIRHVIPTFAALGSAREEVVRAGRAKPDRGPMRLGFLLWGLLSLALGAPVAHAVAYLLDLHREGGLAEALLGPVGYLTGGLLLFLPVWGALRWHLRQRTRKVREAVGELAKKAARLLRGSGGSLEAETVPSVRSFLESCLELTAAAAGRGFALRLLERTVADTHLAERLLRSVDIQLHRLTRRAEDLGVRTTLEGTTDDEDLTHLLDGQGARRSERLIGPESLHDYYRRHIRDRDHLRAHLESFLEQAGGVARWRMQACLADTEGLLDYGRTDFASLVEEVVSDQHFFADDVGRKLLEFVARCYSNIGFGAEFRGYEGLDPDGVQVIADAALVLHPELAPVYRHAVDRENEKERRGKERGEPAVRGIRTTKTMEIQKALIRPNAAYMLSLVQGIRVHSVRNLRRFESFHDRVQMPDDRAFPLTPETPEGGRTLPVNSLTGYRERAREWTASLSGLNGRGSRGESR